MRGLSLVAVSGGHSSLRCASLSLSSWPLLFRSTGSRRAGSVTVVHGPSCSAARGILPDQGSNPCPLRWQADSQPMRHRGSPKFVLILVVLTFPWKQFIVVICFYGVTFCNFIVCRKLGILFCFSFFFFFL